MNQSKTHIINRFAALLLLFVFLLPAMVSFAHTTSDHQHFDTCKFSGETHIHESQLDCDLGDLHMVKVGVFAFAKAYSIAIPEVEKLIFDGTYVLDNTPQKSSQDRGPPIC